ncbi:hypothetical protein BX616_002589 [Lobosporangium transversale]|uniref:Putative methyltransferase-domain-containing protein n=1 Tax=Lobosporangium transversale TaxID=64571 RepID=A0A1Y2G5L1_9FUNG|nr:putative methyltransferase-domain-containing protein [Lobosporangium transversale]KAF9916869.1 hypothetical protein BX616_002589 [Lobosporangium transversale]ORY95198.1 putative methyltransferase-domain-containing protein [Lobosporangium transversale]|eukprot:XP_021875398.1 putative methyltransferase-domain-containing protein [Lobosporangium transversale]
MTNHPEHLDIHDSGGPPAGILSFQDTENNGTSAMVTIMQDIPTFGIAGRIWDSSYAIDIFLRRPSSQYTFTPSCPIPHEYFIDASNTANCSNRGEQSLDPIRIVELGAGTGYVGIALAKRLRSSCTVVLTDLEEVIPLLEKNVRDNIDQKVLDSCSDSINSPIPKSTSSTPPELGSSQRSCAKVEVKPLAWGNSTHAEKILAQGRVDYIVASDLVYFPELYPPLLETLKEVTDLETRIIFGYKERAHWKELPFWEQFGRFFKFEVVRIEKNRPSTDPHQSNESDDEESLKIFGSEEDMFVFIAKKRRDEEILAGVDDTLTTLMMMQIRY